MRRSRSSRPARTAVRRLLRSPARRRDGADPLPPLRLEARSSSRLPGRGLAPPARGGRGGDRGGARPGRLGARSPAGDHACAGDGLPQRSSGYTHSARRPTTSRSGATFGATFARCTTTSPRCSAVRRRPARSTGPRRRGRGVDRHRRRPAAVRRPLRRAAGRGGDRRHRVVSCAVVDGRKEIRKGQWHS